MCVCYVSGVLCQSVHGEHIPLFLQCLIQTLNLNATPLTHLHPNPHKLWIDIYFCNISGTPPPPLPTPKLPRFGLCAMSAPSAALHSSFNICNSCFFLSAIVGSVMRAHPPVLSLALSCSLHALCVCYVSIVLCQPVHGEHIPLFLRCSTQTLNLNPTP